MYILYSAQFFDIQKIDSSFIIEEQAAQKQGFKSEENNIQSALRKIKILDNPEKLIVRSWMLTDIQYKLLYQVLLPLQRLITNPTIKNWVKSAKYQWQKGIVINEFYQALWEKHVEFK